MDPYYQKLPFTLEKDQYNYDFLVLGTGLLECLLAAHFSKIQKKKGIVIDTQKTYGSVLKTLSLREFDELTTADRSSLTEKDCPLPYQTVLTESEKQKNREWIDKRKEMNKMRGFNIDFQPRFFYGNSVTCDILKDADMDKYMDFRIVGKILFIYNNKLEPVPLSKGTIFQSKVLSLMEKKQLLKTLHTLVKIHNKYKAIESDANSTNEFDKDTSIDQALYGQFSKSLKNFCYPFLQKVCNNNDKIIKMIAYVICNYGYNITKPIPPLAAHEYTVQGMIERFGKFVRSCGIYGETPYLYVDNGIGDIPQAFSRIASIFGSIFILHPKVQLNEMKFSDGKYTLNTNLCPEGELTASNLFMGTPFVKHINSLLKVEAKESQQKILRIIVICQKLETMSGLSSPTICHLYDIPESINPVTVFLFDNTSSNCPADLAIINIETILTEPYTDAMGDSLLNLAVRLLNPNNSPEFIHYVGKFVQTNFAYEKHDSILQGGLWSMDLDGPFQQFKERIGILPTYFRNDPKEPGHNDEGDEPDYYQQLLNKLQDVKTAKVEQAQKKEGEKEGEVSDIKESQESNEVKEENIAKPQESQPKQVQDQQARTEKEIVEQKIQEKHLEESQTVPQPPVDITETTSTPLSVPEQSSS